MARQRSKIGTRNLVPGGRQGQILVHDPSSPWGVSWRDPLLRSLRDLPGSHPGTFRPTVYDEWIRIGGIGDAIPFDNAAGNDWQAVGTLFYYEPMYFVDSATGYVRFRGTIKKTDASSELFGSPLFTMPQGLRLKGWGLGTGAQQTFICHGVDNAGNNVEGHVSLWSHDAAAFKGQFRYIGPHFASIAEMDLCQITYLVEDTP